MVGGVQGSTLGPTASLPAKRTLWLKSRWTRGEDARVKPGERWVAWFVSFDPLAGRRTAGEGSPRSSNAARLARRDNSALKGFARSEVRFTGDCRYGGTR